MSEILIGLDDDKSATTEVNDFLMAKQVCDRLNSHYPGHLWAVNVDGGTRGVINIRNFLLSPLWGYVIRLPDVYSASWLDREVVRAGGEILERFGLRRGRLDEAQYAQLPTNFAGDPLFEK